MKQACAMYCSDLLNIEVTFTYCYNSTLFINIQEISEGDMISTKTMSRDSKSESETRKVKLKPKKDEKSSL